LDRGENKILVGGTGVGPKQSSVDDGEGSARMA
jgi:hypothetical protein